MKCFMEWSDLGYYKTNNSLVSWSNHKMKKRKEQKFQVLKARTNRMKKSPIIYMQNLLNCDEERKINDTKVVLNSVNGDLCVNDTLSPSISFK